MPTLEKDTEDTFTKRVRYLGCKAKKFRVWGEKGPPDRIILCPNGLVCFIEFKRTAKDKTSYHQDQYIKELRELGFRCLVTHSWIEAVKFIVETIEDHKKCQ